MGPNKDLSELENSTSPGDMEIPTEWRWMGIVRDHKNELSSLFQKILSRRDGVRWSQGGLHI